MRIASHFLPKFENQSEACRLTRELPGQQQLGDGSSTGAGAKENEEEQQELAVAVTKKHSGSLVMAPPFYSKNGTGNLFSRTASWLLRTHFEAAWRDSEEMATFRNGSDAFQAWWRHAEQLKLCYSFECVCPRLLGDHGATPRGAYLVLTTVASQGRFLAPAETLLLATQWRLPVNESWFVSLPAARELEDRLHEARWSADDAQATEILDSTLRKELQAGRRACRTGFLTHGETQGDVLEGFVLMLLRVKWSHLDRILRRYNELVLPLRGRCLAAVEAAGLACHNRDPKLLELLDRPLPFAPEPERTGGDQAAESTLWRRTTGASGEIGETFRCLERSYVHACQLKGYTYKSSRLVQVHVREDAVFFGWDLHRRAWGAGPLFRGMVVSVEDDDLVGEVINDELADAVSEHEMGMVDGSTSDSGAGGGVTEIVSIAKLKCLRYLVRTFGIRNLLSTLLNEGADAYLARTKRFFRNWKVPEGYTAEATDLFTRWATWVENQATATQREELQAQAYLQYLEPIIERRKSAIDLPAVEQVSVVVVDLSGQKSLSEAQRSVVTAGHRLLDAGALRAYSQSLMRGAVYFVCTPPPAAFVKGVAQGRLFSGLGVVMVVLKATADCVRDRSKVRYIKMTEKMQRDAAEGRFDLPNLEVVFEPTAAEEVQDAAERLATYREEKRGCKDEKSASSDMNIAMDVVAVCALPPGGGKSTLFGALQRAAEARGCHAQVVASDAQRFLRKSNGGSGATFEQAFDSAVRLGRTKAGERKVLLAYDKNIPDADGLRKMVSVLSASAKRFLVDLRVLLVIPRSIHADICWQRVSQRSACHHGLHLHDPQLGRTGAQDMLLNRFVSPASAWLKEAALLPAVVTSDAFWAEDVEQIHELAATVYNNLVQGNTASLRVLLESIESLTHVQETIQSKPNFVCVQLDRVNAHVTLVPPVAQLGVNEKDRVDALHRFAPLEGLRVRVRVAGQYYIAQRQQRPSLPEQQREQQFLPRVCFWAVESMAPIADNDDEKEMKLTTQWRDAEFSPQRAVYHITDIASCSGGGKPADVPHVLAQRHDIPWDPNSASAGSLSKFSSTEWTVTTVPCQPFEIEGCVQRQ